MRSRRSPTLCTLLLSAITPVVAQASLLPHVPDQEAAAAASACQTAISAAEATRHVPDAFLAAIARVESGRPDPETGTVRAWPWSVNAEGVGTFYQSKAEAIAAVQALQARGVRSIDVGCLQVNLLQHPQAFAGLEQAFDPVANAAYAADFLVTLFGQTGSWPLAAAAYHSQTPGLGGPYQKRVLAEWATPQDGAQRPRRSRHMETASAAGLPQMDAGSPSRTAPSAAQIAPAGRMGTLITPQSGFQRPAGMVGRSLAAYRAMPARLATIRGFTPG